MDYTVKRSLRAKKMRLKLSADGSLLLVLPRFVPELAGRLFVESNRDWVKAQRTKLPPVITHYKNSVIDTGTLIRFYDQNLYTVKVLRSTLKKDYFESRGDELILYLGVQNGGSNKEVRLKKLVEKLYKDVAREYLTQRVDYWAAAMNLDYNVIRIKSTKSRWGSCSTKNNLNFNWRIMMAPKSVIDYLVVHEVAHLKHMNHSAKFWDLVAQYDPEFKTHKKWLHDNQQRLLGFLPSAE